MTGTKHKTRWWLIPVPLLVIAAGYFGTTRYLERNRPEPNPDPVYTLWAESAEVAPRTAAGNLWDLDKSAPDLEVLMVWQDQIIYRSGVCRDALLAYWEPVALRLDHVMQGEVSTSSIQQVARVKGSLDPQLTVAVFDQGAVHRAFVGGWEIPIGQLQAGTCVLTSDDVLRRLVLRVTEEGPVRQVTDEYTPAGARRLIDSPEVIKSVTLPL